MSDEVPGPDQPAPPADEPGPAPAETAVEAAAGEATGAGGDAVAGPGGADVASTGDAAAVEPGRARRRRRLRWAALALLAVAGVLGAVLLRPRGAPPAVREVAPAPGPSQPLVPLPRPSLTDVADLPRLTGTVVDALGQPLAGIAITATPEPLVTERGDRVDADAGAAAPAIDAGAAVAISDGDGRFAVPGLAAGRYRVEVSGAGVFTAEVRFVPVPSDELRLVLARKVAVVGRVTDGGAAVPGAVVAIDGDALGAVRSTVTADDGSFGFAELPEGTYRVWGGKGDLVARAQAAPRLGRGPFADVELYLEQGTIVVGHVVDRVTGAGVAAAVMLSPQDEDDPDVADEAPRFARTDAAGVFRIEAVPHGRWTADAWAPGWLTTGSVDFPAGRAMPTIELVAGGVLEGRVIDGAGRPVAGVEVVARSEAGREVSAADDDVHLRRFSGQARAEVPGAAPTAFVDDARFIPRGELGVLLGPIPYPPAAGAGVVRTAAIVEPAPPGVATGPAGPAGPAAQLGLSAAVVAPLAIDPAYQPTWLTGDDGRFRLTGVPAGSYVLFGRAPGHPVARSKRLAVRLGQIVSGVELRLVDGVHLAGTVRDQHGAPVAGALLALSPAGVAADEALDAPGALQAVTDGDGRYRVGPLAGPTTVRVSAFGHADAVAQLDLPAAGDSDTLHDVVLVVADAELVGVVEDPAGLPVVGARVEIVGGPADGRAATAGEGGRWTIAMLPPGALSLRVEATGFPGQRFPASPGAEARLRLQYGGGIEGVVFDHHTGDNLAGLAVTASGPAGERRDLVTDERGRLALVPIVAGAWTLRVKVPGYLARSQAVTVPAGDRPGQSTVRDVRLELERGALVAGLVRDRAGNRVAGARVWIVRGDDEVAATTDALGEFRLRDVPTGAVTLRASRAGAQGELALELRAGDERLSVELALR